MGPSVSLVICTRDRSAVHAALETALASHHQSFEVILVDQSRNPTVESLPAILVQDPRFRYVRSDAKGVSHARNLGLQEARADVVAFTDDDCTVPTEWLRTLDAAMRNHPEVGMAYTNVEAAPHDGRAGFIPTYRRRDTVVVRSLLSKCRARGMGAAMAVRRGPALDLGGFDGRLGPGADFPSCEEGDMAVRFLLRGWTVLEVATISVVHHGFRTWREGRALARRNWFGVGAAYAKPLKCGHLSILLVLGYELVASCGRAFAPLARLQRPRGLRDVLYLLHGVLRGLQQPVDCRLLIFGAACLPSEERDARPPRGVSGLEGR